MRGIKRNLDEKEEKFFTKRGQNTEEIREYNKFYFNNH